MTLKTLSKIRPPNAHVHARLFADLMDVIRVTLYKHM